MLPVQALIFLIGDILARKDPACYFVSGTHIFSTASIVIELSGFVTAIKIGHCTRR
jgi:hypothetical protein